MAQSAPIIGFEPIPALKENAVQARIDEFGVGPANRALSELSLALDVGTANSDADKWSTGKSLRFIAISCGLFWLTAVAVVIALH